MSSTRNLKEEDFALSVMRMTASSFARANEPPDASVSPFQDVRQTAKETERSHHAKQWDGVSKPQGKDAPDHTRMDRVLIRNRRMPNGTYGGERGR